MPYEIKLDNLPQGYVLEPVQKGSQNVQTTIAYRGFVSSEDGNLLVKYLEGISDGFFSKLSERKPGLESTIDNLLIIVRKDMTATIYINEIPFVLVGRSRKGMKTGDPVMAADIVDVQKLKLNGIEIPQDAGVVLIISSGWRKGLFFDYGPILSIDSHPREYDHEMLFGQFWTYLTFQDRLKITDQQWEELFKQKWFPFNAISAQLLQSLLTCAAQGWDIGQHADDLEKEALSICRSIKEKIANNPYFENHRQVFLKAIEHFENKDYLSSTLILYPRIEGVLRAKHIDVGMGAKPDVQHLVTSAVQDPSKLMHSDSLLMPEKFSKFLEEIFYKNFDSSNVKDVSRHSLSHGVAPEKELLDKKAAILGIFVLDQLSYFMYVLKKN